MQSTAPEPKPETSASQPNQYSVPKSLVSPTNHATVPKPNKSLVAPPRKLSVSQPRQPSVSLPKQPFVSQPKQSSVPQPKQSSVTQSRTPNTIQPVKFLMPKTVYNQMQKQKQSPSQQENVSCQPHKIPSFNICLKDLEWDFQEKRLGEGTFGICFKSKYKGIPVAVKVFKDEKSHKTVHREADLLANIPAHSGIPLLIGVNTISIPFLLLTKVCESEGTVTNLVSFIQEKAQTQPSRVCFELLLSLCAAINHVHESGILHNDVKPNNVAIDEICNIKRCVLLDFGKACFIKECRGK